MVAPQLQHPSFARHGAGEGKRPDGADRRARSRIARQRPAPARGLHGACDAPRATTAAAATEKPSGVAAIGREEKSVRPSKPKPSKDYIVVVR
jgi:hypothetical protein